MTIAGHVLDLKTLVDYHNGSVVSREIVDRETGSVTLFAFDRGQGLSEHTAPFDAMVQILDGEAEITIDGTPRRVTEGQALIMPAHHPHSLKAVERFKMLLIMIRS